MVSTRHRSVLVAVCAAGLVGLCLSGCRKGGEEPVIPPSSPASYMKDPAFMAKMEAGRAEMQAVLKERAPLMARMEELTRAHRDDLAALQKLPEWAELHRRIVALNAKYEALRQNQLKVFQNRISK